MLYCLEWSWVVWAVCPVLCLLVTWAVSTSFSGCVETHEKQINEGMIYFISRSQEIQPTMVGNIPYQQEWEPAWHIAEAGQEQRIMGQNQKWVYYPKAHSYCLISSSCVLPPDDSSTFWNRIGSWRPNSLTHTLCVWYVWWWWWWWCVCVCVYFNAHVKISWQFEGVSSLLPQLGLRWWTHSDKLGSNYFSLLSGTPQHLQNWGNV